jgi:hypothetical protein
MLDGRDSVSGEEVDAVLAQTCGGKTRLGLRTDGHRRAGIWPPRWRRAVGTMLEPPMGPPLLQFWLGTLHSGIQG